MVLVRDCETSPSLRRVVKACRVLLDNFRRGRCHPPDLFVTSYSTHRHLLSIHPHTTTITTPIRDISRSSLFVGLLLLSTLRLGSAAQLLAAVLALLALLSGGLLDLVGVANTDQSVVGLELLHGLYRVVDEGETGRLAATVLGAHAEDIDLVLVRLVDFGELAAEVVLADIGGVGVKDITIEGVLVGERGVVRATDGSSNEWEVVGIVQDKRDLHNHLLAGEQAVGDELASSDRDLSVGHDCSRWKSRTANEGCRIQRCRGKSFDAAMKWCRRFFWVRGLACEILGRCTSPQRV